LTEDRFGNCQSAYSFDGDDLVTAPNPFPSAVTDTDQLTISVWINSTLSYCFLKDIF
jgi:hypothetical protein